MPEIDFIRALFKQATATGSKETILNPLQWMLAILVGSVIMIYYFKLPTWILSIMFGMTIITFIIFVFTYFFCLFKNPDALRSEKYSIQKMVIEKGLYGDSLIGPIDPEIDDVLIIDENISEKESENFDE